MLRSKIQKELDRMESLDVIEKVSTLTPWVNSMVTIVKPNGTLRLCINPQELNKAIRCEHYLMQTHRASGYQNAQCHHILSSGCQLRVLADKAGPGECQTMHFQQSIWEIHV